MSETTLILLKPDCVQKGHCGDVIQRFEAHGFKIRGIKMLQLTNELLLEHYAHIASRPFFPEVQEFMQKTPVVALAIEGDDVVSRVRDLLGPTNSKDAAPGTIRGDYGVDMMVNVVHASDSVDNAKIELNRFFAPGELFAY
jgi:nucleoside-diphosphate kinase